MINSIFLGLIIILGKYYLGMLISFLISLLLLTILSVVIKRIFHLDLFQSNLNEKPNFKFILFHIVKWIGLHAIWMVPLGWLWSMNVIEGLGYIILIGVPFGMLSDMVYWNRILPILAPNIRRAIIMITTPLSSIWAYIFLFNIFKFTQVPKIIELLEIIVIVTGFISILILLLNQNRNKSD